MAEPVDLAAFAMLVAVLTTVGAIGVFIFFTLRERRARRHPQRDDVGEEHEGEPLPAVETRPASARSNTPTALEHHQPRLAAATMSALRQHNAAVDNVIRGRAIELPALTPPPYLAP